MTQLYKKNGAVFIPAGITVEEVEKLKDDNKVMADNYSKIEQKFYDNFTKANKLIDELSSSLSVVGECGEEEIETKINKAYFNEQDILVFPHNRRSPENLSSVIKFLFGNAAVATEYYVDNFSFLKITGANYILKDVKTLNADFIVKEVKTREVKYGIG